MRNRVDYHDRTVEYTDEWKARLDGKLPKRKREEPGVSLGTVLLWCAIGCVCIILLLNI